MAQNNGTGLKIFLPHQCLSESSGILLGFHQSSHIVVTAMTLLPRNEDHVNILQDICPGIQVVGEWDHEVLIPAERTVSDTIPYDELLFSLRKVDSEPPMCKLLQRGRDNYNNNEPIILLYNPDSVTNSQYLMEQDSPEDSSQETNLKYVWKSIAKHKTAFSYRPEEIITSFVHLEQNRLRIKEQLAACMYRSIALALCFIHWIFSSVLFCNPVCNVVLSFPAIVAQLKFRFSDLRKCVEEKGVRQSNTLFRHVVDVMMGLSLMYLFITHDGSNHLAQWLMMWAHNVASQLQELIEWLMGVPAGLKLNSQLDKFLGKFFIYHIYLWTGYLSFLGPVLSNALWFVSLFGVLGVSAQLALAQDLLSMMTLHIYCFYVYAARLYSLQIYGLSSLWRLFRGKKWNVLRKRVDSARYDVDQLFIGTLLFTVLLFLLPTTLLYYVVFTTLRLVVLTLQGLASQVTTVINNLPVYVLLLRCVQPQTVASEPRFHVPQRNPVRPLFISLELDPPPLGELLRYDNSTTKGTAKYTWKTFWKKILVGQLVYPWIDPKD